MNLIDTHAHLYLDQFSSDRDEIFSRMATAGISKVYLPNIDAGTIDALHSLCAEYPETALPAMGLHPCSVDENFHDVLDNMEALLNERDYKGIGETGIDLYWDTTKRELQEQSFQRQIDWCGAYKLPIIIHSRSALSDTISMIKSSQKGNLTGVFHCFDGTETEARQIIDAGFYLGIGGTATYKKSKTIDVLKKIGLDRVVLETDAPYLSPVPYRGKRNESSFVAETASFIATQLDVPLEEVCRQTTENANQLFG